MTGQINSEDFDRTQIRVRYILGNVFSACSINTQIKNTCATGVYLIL